MNIGADGAGRLGFTDKNGNAIGGVVIEANGRVKYSPADHAENVARDETSTETHEEESSPQELHPEARPMGLVPPDAAFGIYTRPPVPPTPHPDTWCRPSSARGEGGTGAR
jgi:hypothetical protein